MLILRTGGVAGAVNKGSVGKERSQQQWLVQGQIKSQPNYKEEDGLFSVLKSGKTTSRHSPSRPCYYSQQSISLLYIDRQILVNLQSWTCIDVRRQERILSCRRSWFDVSLKTVRISNFLHKMIGKWKISIRTLLWLISLGTCTKRFHTLKRKIWQKKSSSKKRRPSRPRRLADFAEPCLVTSASSCWPKTWGCNRYSQEVVNDRPKVGFVIRQNFQYSNKRIWTRLALVFKNSTVVTGIWSENPPFYSVENPFAPM